MRSIRLTIAAVAMVATILLFLWQVQRISGEEPRPVLRVPCKIVEVVDGDTVTVEVTLRARVRLTDCWAKERTTRPGARATRYLQQTALDKNGVVEVDLSQMRRLDDVFSFGRILGRIYIDGEDIGDRVVRAGHASATKE